MKAEEGTDSLDTVIRQAVGKEPLFSFARTGDSSVQWIQLLHAFDQQDAPGWPLLAPIKIQMHKCDKCAREFCSSINYRRHIRVHRRSMNLHKDSQKYRALLGAFWDKLSSDEAKEIMFFGDVSLEEVPGSSIARNMITNLRKPIFLSLPQVYVKAGAALADVIQGSPSRLPISSEELFSILDDASERTFLCAGTAESVQKYVLNGEAGRICLEMKNLIACTSFLIEQTLVKAWIADKDAEALRCQKLLVEEEEAAQRRQAEVLERKRQRKLRQKEQRVRDQCDGEKVASNVSSSETTSSSPVEVDPYILEPIPSSNSEEIDMGCSSEQGGQWEVPKSQRGSLREQKGTIVWTKELNSGNGREVVVKSNNDAVKESKESNCQLMIGSISVTLTNCRGQHEVNNSQLSTVMFLKPPDRNTSIQLVVEENRNSEEEGNQKVEAGGDKFPIDGAKAFLSQRWKEATSGQNVELLVSDRRHWHWHWEWMMNVNK